MWALFEAATREILDKWDLLRTAVIEEWGGRSSKAKYEVIVSDLLMNVEEQWKAGHDLHVDTLDVYLLEVSSTFAGMRRCLSSPLLPSLSYLRVNHRLVLFSLRRFSIAVFGCRLQRRL